MLRLSLATTALCALASGACGRAPSATDSHALVANLAPADTQAARRMGDSVYRYAGSRPDAVVLRPGALVLHMPAGALGESARMARGGCTVSGPPFVVAQTVARHAYRELGSARGVDTVFVVTASVAAGRRGWFGRGTCSATSEMHFLASELQARDSVARRSVTQGSHRFAIIDPAGSDGGARRRGQCARVTADRASGTRLTLRGWDERTETRRVDSVTTIETFQHGFYAPADARAVGLSPGQEYEVDCRTFEAVGVNTPDLRPAS